MPGFRETADQRLPQYTVGPGNYGIDDNTPERTGSGWRPKNVIPAKAAVSKRHPGEAQTPEIVIPAPLSVIPAKAGIQAGWSGETPL